MRRVIRKLFRRHRLEQDLEAELAFHREMATERGNPIPLGSTLRIAEQTRDVWRFAALEDTWRDVRYAWRSLRRQPAFTAFALLALVLGVGLNLAVFTVFSMSIFRQPAGVSDPERLVSFYDAASGTPAFYSPVEYRYFRDHARTLAGLASQRTNQLAIDGQNRRAEFVSGNYFDVLGIRTARGRGLARSDDREPAPAAVVVLSHRLWQSQYGGDPEIVGRDVRLNGVPFRVVGIADPALSRITSGMFGPSDLWAPIASQTIVDEDATDDGSESRCCWLVARLTEGATRQQAQAEIDVLASRLANAIVTQDRAGVRQVRLGALEAWFIPRLSLFFLLVQIVVGSILLLACANVGSLLLARGVGRHREITVRLSLGAGRLRVVRQLLIESLLLATAATVLVLLIVRASPLMWSSQPGYQFPFYARLWRDLAVSGYALGTALLATVLCGLAPALRATRTSLSDSLKQQSAHASQRLPLRGVLLGTQVAISVALVACAALSVRALWHVSGVDLGFKADRVAVLDVQLPWQSYQGRERAFFDGLLSELAAYGPVGMADSVPPYGSFAAQLARTDGTSVPVQRAMANAAFFDILGIPIVAGRQFRPDDRDRQTVIINQTMARQYWPGANPIGQRLIYGRHSQAGSAEFTGEIIGIVRDAHLRGPGPVEPTFFELHDAAGNSATLLLPENAAGTAAATIRRLERRARVEVSSLAERAEWSKASARVLASIALALGGLALLLATTGVYGAFAFSVEQQRREIGIRMALGATSRTIVGLVLHRDVRPLACGLAVGVALALAVSTFLQSSLYGLSRLDPMAYAGVMAVLLLAGVAACIIPARRAASTNPIEVLHAD